jgi:hypothetical protein
MSGFNHYDASKSQGQQYPASFVATRPFNYDFFTYTTSVNSSLQTIGTLAYVTTTAGLTPVGRVLHATGRKLYPNNINPMNVFPTANTATGTTAQNGTLLTGPKFLVGVYDPITTLRGFIDPTSSMFAKYDQLLDNAFDLGPTANTAVYGSSAPPLGGQAGRLTLSDVGSALTGTAAVGSSTVPLTASTGVVTCNSTNLTIYTTACTVNSKIFLTTTQASVIANQRDATAAASFQIQTNGTTNVHWLVVN